ncbi:hypothetical protein ZEAMMB73_Zm00001d020385, partial [Zea mays]
MNFISRLLFKEL